MTLAERKRNPVITAMLRQTLTEPQTEEVTGGASLFGIALDVLKDKIKCGFGAHDYYFTGEYNYGYTQGVWCRFPIYHCRWCGAEKQDRIGEVADDGRI